MGRHRDQNAPARVGVSPSLTGPALVGKAVAVLVGEDEMVEQANPEHVASLPESGGQHTILWTGCHIAAGGVIVLCDVSNYVEFLHAGASAPA